MGAAEGGAAGAAWYTDGGGPAGIRGWGPVSNDDGGGAAGWP
jgi:hypothetical protein